MLPNYMLRFSKAQQLSNKRYAWKSFGIQIFPPVLWDQKSNMAARSCWSRDFLYLLLPLFCWWLFRYVLCEKRVLKIRNYHVQLADILAKMHNKTKFSSLPQQKLPIFSQLFNLSLDKSGLRFVRLCQLSWTTASTVCDLANKCPSEDCFVT